MRSSKKFSLHILSTLVCLAALLLAGCGGTSPTQTGKPTPAPASQQILRYPLVDPDIATFDPALITDLDSITVINTVFTGLVTLDDKLNVKGQMATSWDKSPDGLTWTFHLHSGMQFSDGTPLDANDVAYSINRTLQKATQSPYGLAYLGLIKDSEKVNSGAMTSIIGDSLIVQDANTLVIKLNKPGAYFLDAMTLPTSFVVERSLIEKYGNKWTDHLAEGGGAGPFKVSEYSHTKGITLVPNPNYYGPKPRLQQLQYLFYPSSDTVYKVYLTDRVEFTGIPLAHYLADKTLPDFHRVPLLVISFLTMNYLTKPFDDIKIRQAFDLALDKNLIVHAIGKDRQLPTNHIVPQGQPGYNPNLTGPEGAGTQGDPAKAKQLLREGMREEGWTSISQIPTIRLTFPAVSEDSKRVVAAMMQLWQKVLGITVIADGIEGNQLLDEVSAATNNAKGLQFWRSGWADDYPDPQDWTTLQFDKGSPINNQNYGQNQSTDAAEQQQVQQQLEQADLIQDPATRYKAYNDLEQKLVNDVAWLPLWQNFDNYRLKPYVQGYVENPAGQFPPDDWANVYISTH